MDPSDSPAERQGDERPDPERADTDKRWMQRALEVAANAAEAGEVPVGAVIVCGDEELAVGQNTRERECDPCGHAEINALRAASVVRRGDPVAPEAPTGTWRLDDCTIYVTLEPCAMCAGAMVLARVARCVYATPDPKGGFLGTLGDLSAWPGLNHRFEVTSGVMREEAAAQLRGFFAVLRSQRALRSDKKSRKRSSSF